MTKHFLKSAWLVLPLALVFTLNGCRKDDKTAIQADLDEQARVEAIRAKIKANQTGPSFTVELNQQQTITLNHNYDSLVQKTRLSASSTGDRSVTGYVCDGSIYVAKATLRTITSTYSHTDGYQYVCEYLVSFPFGVYVQSPIYSFLPQANATARISDNNRNVVYTANNIPITLTLLGVDPDNASLNQYKVSFTTPFISSSIIEQNGMTFTPAVSVNSDCSVNLIPTFSSDGTPLAFVTATNPCNRIDQCSVSDQDPQLGFLGFYVSGCNVIGNYPGGSAPPYQQFQYRLSGTTTWLYAPVTSAVSSVPGVIGNFETLRFSKLVDAGTYDFRYRNWTADCQGPWTYLADRVAK